MTDQELLDTILNNPAAKALADAGDDGGCAALIAAQLPPTLETPWLLTERGVIASFPTLPEGLAVLGKVEAASQDVNNPYASFLVKVVEWLRPPSDGIDFGHPSCRIMLDLLEATTVLTPGEVATLKATAERPAKVRADDVSRVYLSRRPGGVIDVEQ